MLRQKFGLVSVKEGCGAESAVRARSSWMARQSVPRWYRLSGGFDTISLRSKGWRKRRVGCDPAVFIDCDAVQCGFCTPGMIMSAKALLSENPCPSREEIRTALAGNICRCTGYVQIIDAVETTAARIGVCRR